MQLKKADLLQHVDPELRRGLEYYLNLLGDGGKPAGELSVAAIRQSAAGLSKPPLPEPPVVEKAIPGPKGAPDVTVFVINADPVVPRPAILHIHGGGFIAGDARAGLAELQAEAKTLDCAIVTVDYRLAPEAPFPCALEDNYTALLWLHSNAEALGVDRTRIALQGESAGGGHAAMLAIAACKRGDAPICFQALTFPMLDDRTGSIRRPAEPIGAFLWTSALNVLGWSALLGSPAGGDAVPEGASPARVEDLSGLPPTFIAVGGLDLFVEEDITFANRLIAAGVPTELFVVPGAPHGFQMLGPDASVSRRYRIAHRNALARALGRPERFEGD